MRQLLHVILPGLGLRQLCSKDGMKWAVEHAVKNCQYLDTSRMCVPILQGFTQTRRIRISI